MQHRVESLRSEAERFRRLEAEGLETAFDGMRQAWSNLVEAIDAGRETSLGNLEDIDELTRRITEAMNEAGAASGSAGRASREAAEEAATGWQLAAQQLRKYAESTVDLAGQIGGAMVNAFRSAENAVAEFVRTGKFDFRSFATSIIADMARIATRRFILGPIANAMGGIFQGLAGGGGLGAWLTGGAKIRSYDGGGHTGWGARTGGLDGMGGRLALVHPGERFIDENRPGQSRAFAPATNVHFHGVRDMQSFRQSRSQVAADLSRAVAAGQRGM